MSVRKLWSKVQGRWESGICRLTSRKQVRYQLEHPVVSFTFDDFPASAYHAGGRILEQNEMRGTYYTALGLMGSENLLGEHFSREDLHELHEHGHELACHTYSHHTCAEQSPTQFVQDIERNAELFALEFPDVSLEAFSFPKGVLKPLHHRPVAKRFRCLRTVAPGVNRGNINLNYILAIRLYESQIDATLVDRLITDLERQPGWIVFYTHDVRTNPSQYGTTPGLLESTVARVARSSAKVLTVSDAVNWIGEGRRSEQSTAAVCP
ncbi:MAG: peptidoglycan/xylan/chitin deacetylase (PgdA/CDA1 family) [Pirellulaceae bacterium]|jgi:peptidoglycan/xylan/chitin deacetylase (PgdA/CDA1 family)